MEGMTHLAVAYFGMLLAIALWTWTVVQRSRRLDARLDALETAQRAPLNKSVRKPRIESPRRRSLSKPPLRGTDGEEHGDRPRG